MCPMSVESSSQYIIFSKSSYFIDISRQQQFHKAFRYMISSKSHIILYFK